MTATTRAPAHARNARLASRARGRGNVIVPVKKTRLEKAASRTHKSPAHQQRPPGDTHAGARPRRHPAAAAGEAAGPFARIDDLVLGRMLGLAPLALEELCLRAPPRAPLGPGLLALLRGPSRPRLAALRILPIGGGEARPLLTPAAALELAPRAAALLGPGQWPPTLVARPRPPFPPLRARLSRAQLEEGRGRGPGGARGAVRGGRALLPALHLELRLVSGHAGADLLRALAAALRARPARDPRPVTLAVGGVEGPGPVYGPALAEAVAAAGGALEACEVRSVLPLGPEEAAAFAAGAGLRRLRLAHRCVGPLDPAPHAALAPLCARGAALELEISRPGYSTWPPQEAAPAALHAALPGAHIRLLSSAYRRR
eukprot:tig00001181_g7446.t1